MDKSELKAVLRQVVVDACPSDQDLFDIEADTVIEEEIAGKIQKDSETGDVQSRFGIPLTPDTLSTIDTYIKLIVTAIGALRSLGFLHTKPATLSTDQVENLQKMWQQKLQRAGVPASKSASIARRFSKDLLRAAAEK